MNGVRAHSARKSRSLSQDADRFPSAVCAVYARRSFTTIPEFLSSLPPAAELVALPWKRFGSSGVVHSPHSSIAAFVHREIIAGDDLESLTFNASGGWESGKIYNFKSLFKLQPAVAAFDRVMRIQNGSDVAARASNSTIPVPKGVIWHQHRAFYNELNPTMFLPDGRPLAQWLDHGVRIGPIRSMSDFGLHINHFEAGSCEYYAKVKMTRGDVLLKAKDHTRSWRYFAELENRSNAVFDDELRRKRGHGWLRRASASIDAIPRTWPNRSRVTARAVVKQLTMNAYNCTTAGQWTEERSQVHADDPAERWWRASRGPQHAVSKRPLGLVP